MVALKFALNLNLIKLYDRRVCERANAHFIWHAVVTFHVPSRKKKNWKSVWRHRNFTFGSLAKIKRKQPECGGCRFWRTEGVKAKLNGKSSHSLNSPTNRSCTESADSMFRRLPIPDWARSPSPATTFVRSSAIVTYSNWVRSGDEVKR